MTQLSLQNYENRNTKKRYDNVNRWPRKSLVIFTTLPKVGGHTTITVGLVRLLRPYFESIHVFAKELPGLGVSELAVQALKTHGVSVRCVPPGFIGVLQITAEMVFLKAKFVNRCCLLTIDMGRLSPKLARLFPKERSIYYYIKHELTPSTLDLLKKIKSAFGQVCFISAATAREYEISSSDHGEFPVLIQPSELEKAVHSDVRSPGPVRLGFLGRLSEAKGSRVLLDFVKNCNCPCELLVAGLGEYERDFMTASKSSIDSVVKVRYLGAFDVDGRESFLSSFFTNTDYLLVPTQDEWEGTPTVILEAMQFGVPTIATACGGTVGLSMDPFNQDRKGVVELFDRKDYFRELTRIVQAGPPEENIKGKAIHYFQKHFSNNVIKTQWLKLFQTPDHRNADC